MPLRHRGPLCGESNPGWCTNRGPTGIKNANMVRRSRTLHGVIRMAEEGEIVIARAGVPRTISRFRRAGIRTHDEVNIVGSFPLEGHPWKNDAAKLADMRLDNWFPTDREIFIFANSKIPKKKSKFIQTPDVWSFLNAIYSNPSKRFNLFTHGTILSGKVVKGNVYFKPGKEYNLLGIWYYTAINPGFRFEGKKGWRTLQDLHSIMPSGAKLIIYGCKSGSKPDELKRLSKLLGITVLGFSKSILYHPVMSKDGKTIVNWRYSHGKTGEIVDDYHKLTPDMSSKDIK